MHHRLISEFVAIDIILGACRTSHFLTLILLLIHITAYKRSRRLEMASHRHTYSRSWQKLCSMLRTCPSGLFRIPLHYVIAVPLSTASYILSSMEDRARAA
ncbi:hypothetical protein V8C42DRAFT_305570 [Trichoderma barbatum]